MIGLISIFVLASPVDLYNEGNRKFIEQDFAGARASYEEAIRSGARHSDLYFNLSNAHAELGDIGRAILNVERAIRLNPTDADARHNRLLLRDRISIAGGTMADGSERSPVARVRSSFQSVSPQTWSLLQLVLMIGALQSVLAAFLITRVRSAAKGAALALTFLYLLMLPVRALVTPSEADAILLDSPTQLLASPRAGDPAIFEIPAGVAVRILRDEGEFAEISVVGEGSLTPIHDLVGWVPRASLERI